MKYNHVLALYPYFKDSTATMGIFPPTGLEYIATNIKDHVGKVTLLDLRYEKQYQDVKLLAEFIKDDIDLVCISITWNSQFNPICDLINQLPEDVTTVVGGYKATEEVEYLFESCLNIDIIVRGEGEDTIREVVNGLDVNDILGLSYRKNGTVIHNDPRPLPDISAAAFPDRSLRRHEYHWIQSGARITNLTFDTVLTSRGCPYNCKFCTCSLNPLGQKRQYAERPLNSVIDELKSITADVVMFSDDNFFTNPKRSKQLCDLIVQNGIKKRFCVQTRIEIGRDAELLEKAEKAGFKLFLVGIESPHDKILKQLNKGITQKQTRDAFKTLNKYNFLSMGTLFTEISEKPKKRCYTSPGLPRSSNWRRLAFRSLELKNIRPSWKSSIILPDTTISVSVVPYIPISMIARTSNASAIG